MKKIRLSERTKATINQKTKQNKKHKKANARLYIGFTFVVPMAGHIILTPATSRRYGAISKVSHSPIPDSNPRPKDHERGALPYRN